MRKKPTPAPMGARVKAKKPPELPKISITYGQQYYKNPGAGPGAEPGSPKTVTFGEPNPPQASLKTVKVATPPKAKPAFTKGPPRATPPRRNPPPKKP